MTETPSALPIPQGDYAPAKRHGSLVFTSGMTPRAEGILMHTGPVRAGVALGEYRDAVDLATSNALRAARSLLGSDESISTILSMTVYILAEAGFTEHARLADFASEHLRREIGPAAIGCRAAIGVATLPGNATVEVQLVAGI